MHYTDAPIVGDTVTGVVTSVLGATTTLDDDGNEVTRARFEVEVQEPLVDELPAEESVKVQADKAQSEKAREENPAHKVPESKQTNVEKSPPKTK